MKSRLLLSVVATMLALSGCSDADSILSCDSSQSVNLVKESVNAVLLAESGADDNMKFSYVLTDIQTLDPAGDGEAIDESATLADISLVCSADLAVNLKSEYMDETLNSTINYSVQRNVEDKQVSVTVTEKG